MLLEGFSDRDATQTIVRALRLLALMTVVGVPVVGWKMGWPSAGLLLAGALISAAGLWKWLRLMSTVMTRMEVSPGSAPAKPLGGVLLGFFTTMAIMLVVLYGSLKLLDGSVYALFAGLGMGIVALSVEAIRLVKTWTV
ncbi:MAG: hypothetical protein PW735_05420 [Acidobacteriaceae bacterium]|nr:hypothetical protein [Acidobacteriaceae bacterium]